MTQVNNGKMSGLYPLALKYKKVNLGNLLFNRQFLGPLNRFYGKHPLGIVVKRHKMNRIWFDLNKQLYVNWLFDLPINNCNTLDNRIINLGLFQRRLGEILEAICDSFYKRPLLCVLIL